MSISTTITKRSLSLSLYFILLVQKGDYVGAYILHNMPPPPLLYQWAILRIWEPTLYIPLYHKACGKLRGGRIRWVWAVAVRQCIVHSSERWWRDEKCIYSAEERDVATHNRQSYIRDFKIMPRGCGPRDIVEPFVYTQHNNNAREITALIGNGANLPPPPPTPPFFLFLRLSLCSNSYFRLDGCVRNYSAPGLLYTCGKKTPWDSTRV